MKKTVLIIIAVLAVWAITVFAWIKIDGNRAITFEEQIEKATSNVEISQQKRADLIPNLVECIKSYNEHEYKTFVEVVAERSVDTAINVAEFKKIVVEFYPELSSQENYKNLMISLATCENAIFNARKAYNKSVARYNSYVKRFPTRYILEIGKYEIKTYEYTKFDNNIPVKAFENG